MAGMAIRKWWVRLTGSDPSRSNCNPQGGCGDNRNAPRRYSRKASSPLRLYPASAARVAIRHARRRRRSRIVALLRCACIAAAAGAAQADRDARLCRLHERAVVDQADAPGPIEVTWRAEAKPRSNADAGRRRRVGQRRRRAADRPHAGHGVAYRVDRRRRHARGHVTRAAILVARGGRRATSRSRSARASSWPIRIRSGAGRITAAASRSSMPSPRSSPTS